MVTCWGYSLVVEHLPIMCRALGSIPSNEKKNHKYLRFFVLSSKTMIFSFIYKQNIYF